MIENMDEVKEVAHCSACGQTATRCVCARDWTDERTWTGEKVTRKVGLGLWSGPAKSEKIEPGRLESNTISVELSPADIEKIRNQRHHITAVIEPPTERRINLDNQMNQKSDAQMKLDMLKTVRDMHEKDIMALMRIRSAESMQAANRLVHMGFYDAIEAMEAQLKAELAEA